MEADLRSTLKALVLELRHELEGQHDAQGKWSPGDLERRLAAIGVRPNRSVPAGELKLTPEDAAARRVIDALIASRIEAGEGREEAFREFVRNGAYSWVNRLLALRCMEARGLIDEVIIQKEAYGGRSLQHHRLAHKDPSRCSGDDEGLFATLFDEFEHRAAELPMVFRPDAPEISLRPSVASLRRCVELLSGRIAPKGQSAATDEVFTAPDALGWAYQYWNTEEKDRVFDRVRIEKGFKIAGTDIIPATCIYTEDYIVKFLIQNSLGALWTGMRPDSRLPAGWRYYVYGADRAPVSRKRVAEITLIDPAVGSGHFLIEAFDLLFDMYKEEGEIVSDREICASIFENNLFGIDIDERAIQIAALALLMKAWEKARDFVPRRINLVAANIRLPKGTHHLEKFLKNRPEDHAIRPALEAIVGALDHAAEIGSLLEIDEPLDKRLAELREKHGAQLSLDGHQGLAEPEKWKLAVIARLRDHFNAEATADDLSERFFGEAGEKGLSLLDLLSRRYDVVAANPPYMGSKNMGPVLKKHVERHFAAGKRDLYAAFILKCLRLAAPGTGRVAMVTQQSWMFLRSFADLRALDDDKRKKMPRAFGGVLRDTTIETLAHLGPRAFAEISGEVVNTACFVLAAAAPPADHRLTAFRLIGPKSPEEKDALLLSAIAALGPSPAPELSCAGRPADKATTLEP
jgi:hypothetical protein